MLQKIGTMKFKRPKSSLNARYWLLGLLLIGMTTATTNFFSWTMAGLIVFLLAYLSKGMRRYRSPHTGANNKF